MTKSAIASRIAFLSTRIDATALRDGGNWGCLDDEQELLALQSTLEQMDLVEVLCTGCGDPMEIHVDDVPLHTGLCWACGTGQ